MPFLPFTECFGLSKDATFMTLWKPHKDPVRWELPAPMLQCVCRHWPAQSLPQNPLAREGGTDTLGIKTLAIVNSVTLVLNSEECESLKR